ncbi:MAG: VCBS repeat-containing protein [Bdellovibrionales bacterium]|nr:VCBS repeat-containing protein [Bdellovibrionales bacterium]
MGDGSGGFSYTNSNVFGGTGSDVQLGIADFNDDGILDIAHATSVLSILYGDGDGTFQPVSTIALDSGSAGEVEVGDFNGDGKADIAVAENATEKLRCFFGREPELLLRVSHYFNELGGPELILLCA